MIQLDTAIQNKILKAISARNPAGENIRYTTIYDDLKEQRREEDENLPQGIWKRAFKKADWAMAEKICINILTTQSKDLQILCWLIEARSRLSPLGHLPESFQMLGAFCKKFWDTAFPQIEEDESCDERVALFDWISTKLCENMYKTLVTDPSTLGEPGFTFEDWSHGKRLLQLKAGQEKKKTSSKLDETHLSPEKLSHSQSLTPNQFYENLLNTVDLALKALQDCEAVINQKLQGQEVSFYLVRDQLSDLNNIAQGVLSKRTPKEDSATSSPPPLSNSAPEPPPKEAPISKAQDQPAPTVNPVKSKKADTVSQPSKASPTLTREFAYAQLNKIADFLEKQEPQSLTPLLVRKAANWEKLSLTKVMEDLSTAELDLTKVQKWLEQK